MKNALDKIVFGNDLKLTSLLAVAVLICAGLGCGGSSSGSKPIPPEYFGVWTGQDGSLITIRGDGKGDYKSGGTTVDGGTVAIDDAKKELSITFFGIGPSKKIDSAPNGDEMKLDGVIYKRNGGGSDNKNVNQGDQKSPSADKSSNPGNKSATSSDGEMLSDDELQDLAKTTMTDFGDAIRQKDFTHFFSTAAKVAQRSSSPAKMKNSFQPFIDEKVDLSQIRTLSADFSGAPTYDDGNGYHEMILNGRYETTPLPTKFSLRYTKENGEWKLTGMNVKTKSD